MTVALNARLECRGIGSLARVARKSVERRLTRESHAQGASMLPPRLLKPKPARARKENCQTRLHHHHHQNRQFWRSGELDGPLSRTGTSEHVLFSHLNGKELMIERITRAHSLTPSLLIALTAPHRLHISPHPSPPLLFAFAQDMPMHSLVPHHPSTLRPSHRPLPQSIP